MVTINQRPYFPIISHCARMCPDMADNHIDLFQCYKNLNRVNSALEIKTKKGEKNIKRTLCMAEGINRSYLVVERIIIV